MACMSNRLRIKLILLVLLVSWRRERLLLAKTTGLVLQVATSETQLCRALEHYCGL